MFKDRFDAAKQLITPLTKYRGNPNTVLVAIPRGALQIGKLLADELDLPLDIVLAKKIGAPGQSELAIGAVTLESSTVEPPFPVDQNYIKEETRQVRKLLRERQNSYYKTIEPLELKNKTVILVDDGIATGHTLFAAIDYLKGQGVAKIVVAVPVAPADTLEKVKTVVDEVVCLESPEVFWAIGSFYQNFAQVNDEEAIQLLQKSRPSKT